MKTETALAIAGMSATGLVGTVGIITTAVVAAKGRTATKELADTARRQQRLADAYIDLIKFVLMVGSYAQLTRPSTGVDTGTPAMPDTEAEYVARAKLAGYGSGEVKAKYNSWREAVAAIQQADLGIGMRLDAAQRHEKLPLTARENNAGHDPLPLWEELDNELRPAERTAREALIDKMWQELA